MADDLKEENSDVPAWVMRPASGAIAAFALTAAAVGLASALELQVPGVQVSLAFVLPVVICAAVWGLGASLLCAALSSSAFDFFFTAPRFQFSIDQAGDIATFLLLFVSAVLVSAIGSRLRASRLAADRGAREAVALHRVARQVLDGVDRSELLAEIARQTGVALQRPVMLVTASQPTRDNSRLSEDEEAAARWAVTQETCAQAGEYPFPSSRYDFWPLIGSQAALGIPPTDDGRDRKHIAALLESLAAYAQRTS